MDIATKLQDLRVDKLPQGCWPSSQLVNDLATKAAENVKAGITHPFICVKLADWLPYWAKESKTVAGDGALLTWSLRLLSVYC